MVMVWLYKLEALVVVPCSRVCKGELGMRV